MIRSNYSMTLFENKKVFYPKVEEALSQMGYIFYSEDKIKGKGRSHMSKPDYIAVKEDCLIIGEIKSSNEGPKSGSWRQVQNSDTDGFKVVRAAVRKREKNGEVLKEVGGHEIIIRGQIPDYVRKIGRTYDLPVALNDNTIIKGGYSFPSSETVNVENALYNCNINLFDKIETDNGTITVIYTL